MQEVLHSDRLFRSCSGEQLRDHINAAIGFKGSNGDMRENGPHTKDQLLCWPFSYRHTFKWAYLALIGCQQTLVRTPRFEQRLW